MSDYATGYAHEISEVCYQEGSWSVMFGPISGVGTTHAFLHHECEKKDPEGLPRWMSWYARQKQEFRFADQWCTWCDSEPSDEILTISILMESE